MAGTQQAELPLLQRDFCHEEKGAACLFLASAHEGFTIPSDRGGLESALARPPVTKFIKKRLLSLIRAALPA